MEGLCQFYLELIAIICNIEWMYSRFSVSKNRDYLYFLWWPGEDLNEEPKEYWTKVHILGAVSSPSYTIFVWKFIAKKHMVLGLVVSRFISNDFYMDDGLTRCHWCQITNKFDSWCPYCMCLKWQESYRNHPKVGENQGSGRSWPLTGKSFKRALGMKWCTESDQFHFHIVVHEWPATWRGILSTVATRNYCNFYTKG